MTQPHLYAVIRQRRLHLASLDQNTVKRFRVLEPLQEVTAEVTENQMAYAGPESLAGGVEGDGMDGLSSERYR